MTHGQPQHSQAIHTRHIQEVSALERKRNEDGTSPSSAPEGILAGTRVSLRYERDFDDLLAHIARAGGYVAAIAKPPGQSPDEADRLWVERGAAVEDLADAVHRDLARRLTGARVWGESVSQPGQTVSTEHPLSDGDVVELLAH